MSQVCGQQRILFSRREVAILLGLSARQVTRLISNERLRIVRIGRRTLIHHGEIDRFIKNVMPYTHPA